MPSEDTRYSVGIGRTGNSLQSGHFLYEEVHISPNRYDRPQRRIRRGGLLDPEYLNYLRFVGLDEDGEHLGYDLGAVEALHPAACIGLDDRIAAPGEILLVGLGAGLITRLRRRRA